jgi:hypothetical protein
MYKDTLLRTLVQKYRYLCRLPGMYSVAVLPVCKAAINPSGPSKDGTETVNALGLRPAEGVVLSVANLV